MAIINVNVNLPVPPKAGESILHVVFHGLVSLVDNTTDFRAYLLTMDQDHKYFGGTWLAEREIPFRKQGNLKGVDPGAKKLDPTENPVLKVKKIPKLVTQGVHAVLVLPKPREIYYLSRGKISIISGVESLVQTPTFLSAVRVFEYRVKDFNEVKIEGMGLDWVCGRNFTTFANGARVATVHIFDAPVRPVPPTHHVDEFAVSSKVLGAAIRIDSAAPLEVANGPLPPGLSELELLGELYEQAPHVFSDFVRTGEFNIRDPVAAGGCAACCGGADALLSL